ncbi:HAD family hydrolase [Amycolatopsis sp. YIM 10]|uniref:HAD family hydrolase n=1 Tax=Amycolatopsis sp. YIM 10 TaxID=2653857 RepID=UPI0012903B6A|nr:HAD family phosphatase [Amycolatopsis sp. YIM 10]QFU94281.1 Phosphoglycolate phosphatase [Amycolatopsis sp. YIM 10]
MTTGDEAKARELLANAKALLLDFDGPICSVFAGLPASTVAEQLRVVLADGGHTELPESVATTDDPFDVFRHAATLGDDEARYVEAAFTALEVEAITTAEPTPGAHDLIHAWRKTGRPLAIVSNNSAIAIETYLRFADVKKQVDHICAREFHDPSLLKPSPHLTRVATINLQLPAFSCILVGDSGTDMLSARSAGVTPIGFANKVNKLDMLNRTGAAAVISHMPSILLAQ